MKIVDFKKILGNLNKKNLAIIGHMGSGKSIFGKKIANSLNIKHIDTDKEISRFENAEINEIFSIKGEAYFRKVECNIISKILNKKNIIISLGGGAILSKKIREELKIQSLTVFLEVELRILNTRLLKSKNRPLLIDVNILSKIKELDLQRKKYFLNADLIINNSRSLNRTILDFNKLFSSLNVKNHKI